MDNTINNLFINSIGNNTPVLIQVKFYGRADLIEYPATLMDLLKTDKHVQDIISPETGEVLFTHDI